MVYSHMAKDISAFPGDVLMELVELKPMPNQSGWVASKAASDGTEPATPRTCSESLCSELDVYSEDSEDCLTFCTKGPAAELECNVGCPVSHHTDAASRSTFPAKAGGADFPTRRTETEQRHQEVRLCPLQSLPGMPVQKAIEEDGLCVKNTFLDFNAEPNLPASLRRRARSAPLPQNRPRQVEGPTLLVPLPPPTPAGHLLGPTWGSMLHSSSRCRPCIFAERHCKNGEACVFCHLCDASEKKRRIAAQRGKLFSWRQLRKATQGGKGRSRR